MVRAAELTVAWPPTSTASGLHREGALPPHGKFEPIGVSFSGSITSPGAQEAQEHGNKNNPLRKLFIADAPTARWSPR